jgi:hypothetical protein
MKAVATTSFAAILCSSSFAFAQVPEGWKVIKERLGKCQMAVPAKWKQKVISGKKTGAAAAPDKSIEAVVNLMKGTDWAAFKPILYATYKRERDRPKIEDSPNRLWFFASTNAPPGKSSWYVAVPGKAGTCNAQIHFTPGDKTADETATKIVDSIRSN